MALRPRNEEIGRRLEELPSFADSVQAIGDVKLIDTALAAVMDGLCNRPEGFDLVPGFDPIRIAKTDRIVRSDKSIIPAIRLWFVIESETTIKLLYVEEIPDDEEQ